MLNNEFLTTGQAAALCLVTPNTVLKWIQSGYLPARRTAGGHHRIGKRDLERLIAAPKQQPSTPEGDSQRRHFQYCWEHKGNGKVQEKCLKCAVYEMRAQRCYEVAKLAPAAYHAKSYCHGSCQDCDYFKAMHGQKPNVLVVSSDQVLAGDLLAHADEAKFNLEITDCEYNCSAVVNHFKPDFVVVDCILGRRVSNQISNHLLEDPRIPFVRVVLAGSESEFPTECDREIFARIERPFGIQDIGECVEVFDNCR